MGDRWANPGVVNGFDLHVVLDRSGRRLAASLEAGLRDAVREGRLTPATVLPPSRTLAADLGIARNTVAAVYARLVDEGWLVARQGSGTQVAGGPHLMMPADEPADAMPETRPAHDLRAGFPDPTSFPVRWWTAAAREALNRSAAASALGYGPPAGSPELRQSLSRYLGRVRGVATRPDRLVVTAGFTSGLRALADVLRRGGVRAVAVEAFGHAAHRQVLHDAGLDVVALDVDDHGAVPHPPARVGAVVLTPAHQFPLGTALSAPRRAEFVRWARDHHAVIIEDDYDGEFRYDRRALGALQPHAPDHVVYAGTTSKTLAPGLSLGWFALPRHLVEPTAQAQLALGSRPAPLAQTTLAHLIDTGRFDRHIRRMRTHYRTRRHQLTALADQQRWPITGLDAGLHAVVDLPPHVTEDEAVEHCHRRGLVVEGLSSFVAEATTPIHPPRLVIGYGTPTPAGYPNTLQRLEAALRAEPRHSKPVGHQATS